MSKTSHRPLSCGCAKCKCQISLRCRCHDLTALIALTLWDYGRSLRQRKSPN